MFISSKRASTAKTCCLFNRKLLTRSKPGVSTKKQHTTHLNLFTHCCSLSLSLLMLEEDPTARSTMSIEHDDSDEYHQSKKRMHSVADEESANSATPFSCFVNLANTILGSGMLGLPYAFSSTGWVLGSFLLMICGCLSSFALHLLALCALKEKQPSSFYTVAHSALPKFTLLIDMAVAVKCFGVATSYLIVIGDLMPDVMEFFEVGGSLSHRQFWVFMGFIIVAPLSCLRNLDSLKFTSFFAVGFVVFLTILITLYASDVPGMDACEDIEETEECKGDVSNIVANMDTMRVFSIFVFGFTCQQNIFAVKNELINPTPSRINGVIVSAIGTAMVLYFTVSCFGYSTYGDNVESDILTNYPETYLTSFARLFVSLLVAFSYPLQCHPARRCIITLVSSVKETYLAADDAEDKQALANSSPTSSESDAEAAEAKLASSEMLQFNIITVCFLGLSLLLAMTVSDLGVLLSLVGATGSTIVSYILPGFLYYIHFEGEGPVWKRNMALVQGCMGLVIMPVALVFIFA